MFSQKSVLARLLANENITVQQGNFQTASFDVASRTLNMPMWKDMGRDVYDMLVGHEVAHALYTPQNFFEYTTEGIPHSWLNIVEDIRIEKMMLRKYPGLVANFKRGYYDLMMNRDLFGIKSVDVNTLPFMDRLNIAGKARDLINVDFSEEELPFVAKAKACESYDDVVDLCREIQAWLGEKAENEDTPEDNNEAGMDPNGDGESMPDMNQNGSAPSDSNEEGEEEEEDSGEGAPSDSGEDGEEESSDSDNTEESEESEDNGGSSASSEESEEKDEKESGAMANGAGGDPNGEAMTDVTFRENASELTEDYNQVAYARGLTRAELDTSVIPHAKVAEARLERLETIKKNVESFGCKPDAFPESEYVQFMAETKRVVNLMVKEFEMRKAAYRSARARTSTRGSLDVNKLHKYRYEDNLFKQVSQLADAKNHGMMMLIDYSGSMHQMMPSVIRQTLALSMFCKRVAIPFEVYGFTSRHSNARCADIYDKKVAMWDRSVTSVDTANLLMPELLNSRLSKRDYEESFRMLFWQSVSTYNTYGYSDYEELGSTPLNTALMACSYLIDDFRKKYAVEKMNLVTITDGDSDSMYIRYGDDLSRAWPKEWVIEYNKAKIKVPNSRSYYTGRETTEKFIEALTAKGVTTINYFLAPTSSQLNKELKRVLGWGSPAVSEARKQIRNTGVYVSDGVYGYSRRFVLLAETNEMRGEIEELDVDSDMTAAKIAKAFSKNNGSKKKSRIITQKFAELVA